MPPDVGRSVTNSRSQLDPNHEQERGERHQLEHDAGISQPMTMPSSAKAYSRKFQPSEPNSRNHISSSSVGALIAQRQARGGERRQQEQRDADAESADAPSGHGWAETYGPPVAQAPPMSMIARMPR